MIDRELSLDDIAAIDRAALQPDIPFDAELIRAWAELQEVKPYVSRYARQENRLYDRLKRGETVEVRAMLNGREFAIQPIAWEGIIMAYNCLIDGKVSPECKGKILSNSTVKDWTDQLIERA